MTDLAHRLHVPTTTMPISTRDQVRPAAERRQPLSRRERALVGLEVFLAVGALAGGGGMLLDPTGRGQGLPADLLDGTPFSSYLVPGIVLLLANGLLPAVVAVLTVRRYRLADLGHLAVAAALAAWMAGETLLIGWASWMQPFFLAYALVVAVIAVMNLRGPLRNTERSSG